MATLLTMVSFIYVGIAIPRNVSLCGCPAQNWIKLSYNIIQNLYKCTYLSLVMLLVFVIDIWFSFSHFSLTVGFNVHFNIDLLYFILLLLYKVAHTLTGLEALYCYCPFYYDCCWFTGMRFIYL